MSVKGYVCDTIPSKHQASVIVDADTEDQRVYRVKGDFQLGDEVEVSESNYVKDEPQQSYDKPQRGYWDRLAYDL